MSGSAGDRTSEFLAEAVEIVDRIQAGISNLDEGRRSGQVSPRHLNDLFRSAHSLKGLAGIFGIETLVALAHEFENLLHGLRLGKVHLGAELMRVLEETGDVFGRLLQNLQGGEAHISGLDALAARLREAAQGSVEVAVDPILDLALPEGVRAVLTEYEEHRLAENARLGTPLFLVRAVLPMATFDTQLASLGEKLSEAGELLTTLPGGEAPADHIEFKILFTSSQPPSAWEHDLLTGEGELDVHAVLRRSETEGPAPARVEEPEPAVDPEEARSGGLIGDSIRVDLRKLDTLMSVVGELSLVKAEVGRVLTRLRTVHGTNLIALDLQKTSRAFERHLSELQQGLMDVRMVPLRMIFDRLGRTARRIAREMGKDVRFQVTGEDTELDKVLIEELSDPLVHLVRNAIDHGIEPSTVREAAAKSPNGTVSIRAFPKGRHVVIEVSDDGAGIDPVALRRTALELGLVDEERVGSLTQNELFAFIFRPGFSTRREVTEVSGRGVGMDVVKTNIARLSGVIDVASTKGRGSTFTLTLPITLAIVQALVIGVSGRTFALPLSSVLEIRTLEPWEVRTIEGREVVFGRDETIPLLWLSDVFGLGRVEVEGDLRHVIVIGLAQSRLGLIVDELQGQQDIIIKPLGRLLRRVPGIAGATDLGAQGLVLVLDVGELASAPETSVRKVG
ncbi:MAG: chemotaxis protein CheA [Pseudomonadota bacterium]